jgi:hypothetical protein
MPLIPIEHFLVRIGSIEEARDWYPGGKDIVHITEGGAKVSERPG